MPRLVTVALPETRCFAATVPEGLEVAVGTPCVVERGGAPELCRVRLVLDDADACPGPPTATPPARVLRCATDDDLARDAVNHQLGEQAMEQFDREAMNAPQGVHAVAARFSLDRSRLLVVYHADQRFDARRIAASLKRRFQAETEARQVGIRDEAGVLGGIGSCGRATCCATWLQRFRPVNVRMAKAQGLSLNPSTINGSCGRLKCCLAYETGETRQAAGAGPTPESEEDET